jgi:plasmid maintenance system antidote protein VapI
MIRELTRRREPTTPGEILHEEFLLPLGMTQKQLADHLGSTFRTSPEFWLNAQKAVDLYKAARHLSSLPKLVLRAG